MTEKIKMYVPLDGWDLRVLTDDDFYKEVYKKDFEKTLASVTFTDNKGDWYNILVMLCFGSENGNAWIDTSFWVKRDDFFAEIERCAGEPLHGSGHLEITYEDMVINIVIGDD